MIFENINARLAIHYHIWMYQDGQELFCPAYFGVWVDSLAQRFEKVLVIAHRCSYEEGMYQIKASNVQFVDLGEKPASLFRRIARFRHYQKIVAEKLDQFDCVGIRAPTPLAIFIYWVVRQKPVFFLLVGNLWRMMLLANVSTWKKWILTAYWWVDHRVLSYMGNKAVVFGNGPYFRYEFPAIKKVNVLFTSTIRGEDIIATARYCEGVRKSLRLVYVGRVAPDKGLEFVVRAMGRLRRQEIFSDLCILGNDESEEYARLRTVAREEGTEHSIFFAGFVHPGDRFTSYLDTSDVMVIPSIWDFQTRVVWEGMARGLPIIASRGIKSLPLQFKHKEEIYFVDPGNVEQLVEAIEELHNDNELYRHLSMASLRIAKDRTVDRSTDMLIDGLCAAENFNSYLIKN